MEGLCVGEWRAPLTMLPAATEPGARTLTQRQERLVWWWWSGIIFTHLSHILDIIVTSHTHTRWLLESEEMRESGSGEQWWEAGAGHYCTGLSHWWPQDSLENTKLSSAVLWPAAAWTVASAWHRALQPAPLEQDQYCVGHHDHLMDCLNITSYQILSHPNTLQHSVLLLHEEYFYKILR